MKLHKRIRLLTAAAVLLLLAGCSTKKEDVVWEFQNETNLQTDEGETAKEEETESAPEEKAIYVDICGAVQNPGVYELTEGARVYEVINLAGGLLEDADDTRVNRAELLLDGQKIRILTKEESQTNAVPEQTDASLASSAEQGKVNINTADVSLLVTLPGIGQTRAADIIAYRTEHGMFASTEEIMNVGGIKESTYNKIKDKITTE